jgi:hypothetical protein
MVDKGAFPARKRLNEEETMALAYLLSPTFQFVNTAGRPLTGGYLEVYIAGSRDKYYCASDFNGTLHPFRIPLDSLGASVVLADDGHSYDVYAYNRYGSLSMSRYNVSPGGGGISSGSITSTDGSIVITQTQGGVDLRVNLEAPTVMRCSAEDLTSDGSFQFTQVQRDGQGARVVSHNVNIDKGWWHYDATVRIRWQGAAESTQQVGLYTSNGSDTMDFDLSYPHSETVRLSGEYKAAENGTTFTVGFTGIVAGMTASLVDFGIHTITNGSGAGGQYYAGDGIEVNEPDRIISAKVDGTTIDTNANGELEVIGSRDIYVVTYESGGIHPVSRFDDAYAAYQAGKTLVLVQGERRGTFIGDYPPYGLMFAIDEISLEGSAPDNARGVIDFRWLGRSDIPSPHSYWRSTTLHLIPMHKQEDAGKVLTVDTEHPLGTPVWTSLPNFSDFVTDTELSTILEGYQTALSAGANIQINNGTISATDTTYSAGTGLNLSGTEFSADTTVLATKSDIPATKDLVAGSNINITEGSTTVTISATAAPQLQANWAESSPSSVQYIQNKPTIPVLPDTKDLVAGANVTITEGADSVTIAATDTTYTAGTNVQINGTTISATDTTYTAGSGLDLTGTEFSASVDGSTITTNSSGQLQSTPEVFEAIVGVTTWQAVREAYLAGKFIYGWTQNPTVAGARRIEFVEYYTYDSAFVFHRLVADTVGDGNCTVFEYRLKQGNTWEARQKAVQKPADWNAGAGTPTSIVNKPDLSVYVTDTELSTILQGYQEALTAGSNIQISNGTISATDTTYSAGNGLALSGTEFSVDTSVVATQADLANYTPTASLGAVALSNDYEDLSNLPTVKPMAAGNNISITEGASDITVACDITIGTVTV